MVNKEAHLKPNSIPNYYKADKYLNDFSLLYKPGETDSSAVKGFTAKEEHADFLYQRGEYGWKHQI